MVHLYVFAFAYNSFEIRLIYLLHYFRLIFIKPWFILRVLLNSSFLKNNWSIKWIIFVDVPLVMKYQRVKSFKNIIINEIFFQNPTKVFIMDANFAVVHKKSSAKLWIKVDILMSSLVCIFFGRRTWISSSWRFNVYEFLLLTAA